MRLKWLQKTRTVEPYCQLAYVYDYVMRHVDYHRWAQYITELFRKSQIDVRDVLDIACGTATVISKLHDFGYRVAAFDSSNTMVQVAKKKLAEKEIDIPIWQGSMHDFKIKEPMAAIICNYDSFNYCMDTTACISVLKNVAHALKPGGLFIFDISTAKNSKKNFKNYYETDQTDEFQYVRQSYYLANKKQQVNEFFINWKSKKHRRFREVHKQRIYKLDEIEQVIPSDSFELIGIYDDFSLRKGTEKSDRVHFVLKRLAEQ